MYVKVYIKEGKWFRKDTGDLVGEDIYDKNILSLLRKLFGNQHFAIKEQKIFTIYYGFLNNGKLNPLCKAPKSTCESCPLYKNSVFCRHQINKEKDKTIGYYSNYN